MPIAMPTETRNPNYLVMIKNHSPQLSPNENTVIAYLPEQFELRLQSDWEPALANMIENVAGGAQALGRSVAGQQLYDKLLTAQIWRNSDPLDLNLTLLFDAQVDAKRDVTDPIRRLVEWSMPRRDPNSPTIHAPGPTVYQYVSGNSSQNRMSVRIGRMLYLDSVIIPSVDITWYAAPDKPGQFIAADVNIALRTFFTPDSADILQYFQLGSAANLDDSTALDRLSVSDRARAILDRLNS